MAKLDKPPLVSFYRDFTDANVKNVKKQVYKGCSENGDLTVNVPIGDGSFSIEFQIEQTIRLFKEAVELLQFTDEQLYKEFQRCLSGNTLAAWDRVMESDDFKEPKSCTEANFEKAWEAWIFEHHRIKNIGDVMWRHLYRGTIAKAEDVSLLDFFKRFCQMWSSSAKIPEGRLPIPNAREEKAIFYYGHPRRFRIRFDRCGHDLWEKDIDFVAKFMQSFFQKEVDAGLIVPATTKELNCR